MNAATSKQKRAMEQSSSANPVPPPPQQSKAGSFPAIPVALGAAAATGAGYYYFITQEDQSSNVKVENVEKVSSGAEKEEPESEGSRVKSIDVPQKMKNVQLSSKESATHPKEGNRVTLGLGKHVAADDISSTEKAVASIVATQTESVKTALMESHQMAWDSINESYVKDLESLNEAELKARVIQLASEMRDRTKWEAVRLKEFLAMKEKETATK